MILDTSQKSSHSESGTNLYWNYFCFNGNATIQALENSRLGKLREKVEDISSNRNINKLN